MARRRAKKEKLRGVVNNLAAQKDAGIDALGEKIAEIKAQEQADLSKIEKEVEQERKQGGRDIEKFLEAEKEKRLAAAEKKLNDLRNKSGTQNDEEMAEMLNEYGSLVKRV